MNFYMEMLTGTLCIHFHKQQMPVQKKQNAQVASCMTLERAQLPTELDTIRQYAVVGVRHAGASNQCQVSMFPWRTDGHRM